jgi:hypothetical protein
MRGVSGADQPGSMSLSGSVATHASHAMEDVIGKET